MFQTAWTEPTGDLIKMGVRTRVENVLEVIKEEKEKGNKLTITHFAVKAMG